MPRASWNISFLQALHPMIKALLPSWSPDWLFSWGCTFSCSHFQFWLKTVSLHNQWIKWAVSKGRKCLTSCLLHLFSIEREKKSLLRYCYYYIVTDAFLCGAVWFWCETVQKRPSSLTQVCNKWIIHLVSTIHNIVYQYFFYNFPTLLSLLWMVIMIEYFLTEFKLAGQKHLWLFSLGHFAGTSFSLVCMPWPYCQPKLYFLVWPLHTVVI